MANTLENFRAGFGFVYFLFNVVFLVVFAILVVYSLMEGREDPGALMLAFPVLGLFAGHWIRHGRFGWWRTGLMIISLLCSVGAVYLGFFMPAVLN